MKSTISIKLVVFIALAISFSSCSSRLYIEKSPSHKEQIGEIKKVVSIDPTYVFANIKSTQSDFFKRSAKREQRLIKMMETNASMQRLELDIVNKENLTEGDLDYFNFLTPLHDHLMLTNDMHSVGKFKGKGTRGKGSGEMRFPDSFEFDSAPLISSEFSFLAEKYGTPYFAVHGVYVYKARKTYTYYYTAVVNVETAEIIYREIRYTNRKPNGTVLGTILYDSFLILRKNKV